MATTTLAIDQRPHAPPPPLPPLSPSPPPPEEREQLALHQSTSPVSATPLSKTTTTSIYRLLTWTPPRCRWDPKDPPRFSLALNLLFGFAATFTVANLYYTHPILTILAHAFNISYERASLVPTASQAGYAVGLLFLCPLGDLVRRRPFVLGLTWFTATAWLGLCLTRRFEVFVALSFVTSVTTVTPQIMLPLVGDLAPAHRRATALSIVVSGLLLGLLIARLLSGVIAEYSSSWRNVYWMAFGLQYLIVILLWLFMPDYPRTNTDIPYLQILWSIVELVLTTPILTQACLMGFFIAATFTCFWTTLTFLLSGDPYHYSTVVIGLFAFAGIVPMTLGPVYSRFVTDRFVPYVSVVVGQVLCLVGIAVGTYTGTVTVFGPIFQAVVLDFGQQIAQIANRTAIYSVAPKARNRVNTAYMLGVFCGQLMGTAAGNRLYAQGGWVRSGSASVGFAAAALVICLLRGPRETGWIGWKHGFVLRRTNEQVQQTQSPEAKAAVNYAGDTEAAMSVGDDAAKVAGDGDRDAKSPLPA